MRTIDEMYALAFVKKYVDECDKKESIDIHVKNVIDMLLSENIIIDYSSMLIGISIASRLHFIVDDE